MSDTLWLYQKARGASLNALFKERAFPAGLDVKEIATRSTEAYIIQVLKHGFLHSDPHSGKRTA